MNFGILLVFLGCILAAVAAPCNSGGCLCVGGGGGCQTGCRYTSGHSGRPLCTGANNILYRNNNDPTKYWICTGAGPAECQTCPTEFLFSAKDKKCVCRSDWTWSPPCDPDSPADDTVECGCVSA